MTGKKALQLIFVVIFMLVVPFSQLFSESLRISQIDSNSLLINQKVRVFVSVTDRDGLSINNLDKADPFVQAAAGLPISARVRYHTIIGQRRSDVPLASSDDGVVPYWSSHLDGAASEKVVHSGHSVQETPQAVIELKRILREDIREHAVGVATRQ